MTTKDYKLIAKCISDTFKILSIGRKIDLPDTMIAASTMIEVFSNALTIDSEKFNIETFKDYIAKLNLDK